MDRPHFGIERIPKASTLKTPYKWGHHSLLSSGDRGYWWTQPLGMQHTILNSRLIPPQARSKTSGFEPGWYLVHTRFTLITIANGCDTDTETKNSITSLKNQDTKTLVFIFYFFCKSQHSVMTFKHQSPWNGFPLFCGFENGMSMCVEPVKLHSKVFVTYWTFQYWIRTYGWC